MNKNPEQTAATRKRIIDAFSEIYKTCGIEKITVGTVSDAANINRSTFYQYFTDIYDLLEQYEDELLAAFSAKFNEIFSEGIPEDFNRYSMLTAGIFSLFDDKLYALLGAKGDPSFQVKLKNTFWGLANRYLKITDDIPCFDYIAAYAFSAAVGMISHWYETGKQLSTEKFVKLLQSLIMPGLSGVVGVEVFEK